MNHPVSMVQLADVARRAGVSTATVSRVLNHPERVSPPARERVRAAMAELGYLRDGAARALASRRSFAVGSVVPTLGIGIFAAGTECLQRRLQAAGYQLLIATSEYDEAREVEAVRSLIERGVDALALVGHAHAPEIEALLRVRRLPYVCTYQFQADDPHPSIGFDNRRSAAALMDHLLDLGHREIGVVTSTVRGNDRIAARVEGLRGALAARGLPLPASRLVEVPHSVTEGRAASATLLRRHPEITAICATADALALGACFELQAQGRRVPQEVSVAGYDDLEIGRHLQPGLTSVHIPVEEIGERVADYLLAAIEGRDPPAKCELRAELVVRGSTAPPPGPTAPSS